jgi:hypothetical protein
MKASLRIKTLAKELFRSEIGLIDVWESADDFQKDYDLSEDEVSQLRFEANNIKTKLEAMLLK